jgi:hypothetical protein
LGVAVLLLQCDIDGRDGQGAAMQHGISSIDHQIDHYLLDLIGISLDPAQIGRNQGDELDIGAK